MYVVEGGIETIRTPLYQIALGDLRFLKHGIFSTCHISSPRNPKELRLIFRWAVRGGIRVFQIYPLMAPDIQCQILVDKLAVGWFLHHMHIYHSLT
jgi:hypothetical protein